jgi:uncharacterized membrane protein
VTPITGSVEISRSPHDVFDYVNDLSRHPEWQIGLVGVEVEGDEPTQKGTRARETRKVPGGKQTYEYEITEHDPPRVAGFQVLTGPVRPQGRLTLTPLDDGKRTRVDFTIEFKGHGLGKLLLALVNRDARKTVPQDLQLLKQRLESA